MGLSTDIHRFSHHVYCYTWIAYGNCGRIRRITIISGARRVRFHDVHKKLFHVLNFGENKNAGGNRKKHMESIASFMDNPKVSQ